MDHFLPGLLIGFLGSLLVSLGLAVAILMRLGAHRRRMRRSLGSVIRALSQAAGRPKAGSQGKVRPAAGGSGDVYRRPSPRDQESPFHGFAESLQLLQEDLDSNDPAHSRFVASIEYRNAREASRCCGILDDFLKFAGEDRTAVQGKVDLNALLEELVDFSRRAGASYKPWAAVAVSAAGIGTRNRGGGGSAADQADDFEFDDQCAAGDAGRRRFDFVG